MRTVRARVGGRTGSVAVALLAVSGLAGCGDTEDASLCPSYTAYLSVVQPVLDADPTGATAQSASDALEDVIGAVRQLREASDGRYARGVDDLETVLDDLARTLESVEDEADYATWAPLVDDTIEDAVAAHERLVELIDPVCVLDPDNLD
jgi:hypothetical protein